MSAKRTRRAGATPPLPALPTNPMEAMQLVFAAHTASQQAFAALVGTPPDDATRIERHRAYREATTRLLQLLHAHNESGLAPTPWDTTIVAQPLVQQSLMEADFVEAGGNAPEATRLRSWASELAGRELPPLALAGIQLSLTNQRAAEGLFNEALAAFSDLRQQFAEAGDMTNVVQTTLDEVALLDWLGDYERALASLADAQSRLAAQQSGQPAAAGQGQPFGGDLSALMARASGEGIAGLQALVQQTAVFRASVELIEKEARVRKALGEYDKAAALWESVVPHYASLGAADAIEFQLAVVDRLRGRTVEARERLTRIEPAFSSGLFAGKIAGLRQKQSWVELDLGNAARALDLANEGLAAVDVNPDEDLAWRLHWRKAAALRALGRPVDALAAYVDAAARIDSLRKSPLGYRLDSTSLRARLPPIEEGIELAASERDGRTCLRLIEVVKARALSSALSVPAVDRRSRTDLEREFDAVTQRLDALEYRGLSGAAEGADVSKERATLLERRIAVMEQIRLRDPRWRGLTAPAPFDLTTLASALARRKQAALTLYLSGGVVRAVLMGDGVCEVGEKRLDPGTIETLDKYVANLLVAEPDLQQRDPASVGLDAAKFVPAALLEKALSARSLLIAPHSELHLFPWASMPFGGRRLFERVPVGVVPNLTCALSLDTTWTAAPRAALAGVSEYPGLPELGLPSVSPELEALRTMYANRLVAPPLIDAAATEQAVRALATREDAASAILHMACHGTLDIQDPLGSGVLMADGKIDAAEWAQMRLHYDEVVLSACSTGWRPMAAQGIALRGDDVIGLPGALLEAGARAIVVSIPEADDEATQVFMTAYHRRRAGGTSPLIAFCETQRELLASTFAPNTWTGLVCYAVQ